MDFDFEVSIHHPLVVDEFQVGQLSEPDLTAEKVTAGGAPEFIRFMRDELWPWLTDNFNVADDRTYVGDSMGGLFGTYVLLNHPGVFSRYVIGSPWICWDHPLCFNYEEAYAEDHDVGCLLLARGQFRGDPTRQLPFGAH